ncbi:MAG TPA: DUF5818 domain-containing protein [Candidatus Binatia bacterium]|nr:DUF5818 domain-containing protein [Candidatus Binatia bacterium]
MKKTFQWVRLAALASFLGACITMSAQDTAPAQSSGSQTTQPSTPPDTQAPPATPSTSQQQSYPSDQSQPQSPSQPPGQTPDAAGQRPDQQSGTANAAGTQSFTGTIVKAGNKYVFQDAASGNTYDIDHQDEVQKFEGKRVKVRGTLDSSGKTIHLQ